MLGPSDVRRHREVAFRLLRFGVEMAGGAVLAGTRRGRVPEHGLGEGGLSRAVVSDDRDVANLLGIEHGSLRVDRYSRSVRDK